MKTNAYDSYFIHFVGIDHAGHNNAWKHQDLYDISVGNIDNNLAQILKFAKESEEKYTVIIFGDHGSNAHGGHGGYSSWDSIGSRNSFYFTYSNQEEFYFEQEKVDMRQIDIASSYCFSIGTNSPFMNEGTLNLDLVRWVTVDDQLQNSLVYSHVMLDLYGNINRIERSVSNAAKHKFYHSSEQL